MNIRVTPDWSCQRSQICISRQVSDGAFFDVGGEGVFVKIFGKDAEEAAKFYGMYLRHAGRLKCYAEENKPCKIAVRWPAGEACFNAWYTYQTMERGVQGTAVILECCFVRQVNICLRTTAVSVVLVYFYRHLKKI